MEHHWTATATVWDRNPDITPGRTVQSSFHNKTATGFWSKYEDKGRRQNVDPSYCWCTQRSGDTQITRSLTSCCLSTAEKEKNGWSPLDAFDIGRLQFHLPEDSGIRHQCREAFLELLASVKPVGSTHICTIYGSASRNTERLASVHEAEIETVHEDESDDEFFYEARSTFEQSDLEDVSEEASGVTEEVLGDELEDVIQVFSGNI